MSLRLDRLATLYLVNPVQRVTSGNSGSIPILMYHSITEQDESAIGPYYRTATAPAVFAQHMKYLHENGYQTVDLAEAARRLQNGGVTEKSAVITFDDGYSDIYRHALPEMQRYGFSATVFLPTAFIGATPLPFKGKECLTWKEVRELRKCNIAFGSHTVTHPQLATLNPGGVKAEVTDSKKAIEDNLGEPIDTFAYPFAFPETNRSFVGMLRTTLLEAGYRHGVSTRIGTARRDDDPYFLRRLPINGLDDAAFFGAKLQGSYDWLHKMQYASKRLKGRH